MIEVEWIDRRCVVLDKYVASVSNSPAVEARLQKVKGKLRGRVSTERKALASIREYLEFGRRRGPKADTKKNLSYWDQKDLPMTKRPAPREWKNPSRRLRGGDPRDLPSKVPVFDR